MYKIILRPKYLWFSLFLSASAFADLIDPTAPSNYNPEANTVKKADIVSTYTLNAVLISDTKKVAVINDSVVKVGDQLGNEEVTAINAHTVTLKNESGELELKLFENSIKEPAK